MIDDIAGASPARPPRGWAGMLPLEGMLGGECSSYRLWGVDVSVRVAQHNNKGDKIGSLDTAISNDNVVTINRLNDVRPSQSANQDTGKVTAETFFGDSPLGK